MTILRRRHASSILNIKEVIYFSNFYIDIYIYMLVGKSIRWWGQGSVAVAVAVALIIAVYRGEGHRVLLVVVNVGGGRKR